MFVKLISLDLLLQKTLSVFVSLRTLVYLLHFLQKIHFYKWWIFQVSLNSV